jgi:hypothetical protein
MISMAGGWVYWDAPLNSRIGFVLQFRNGGVRWRRDGKQRLVQFGGEKDRLVVLKGIGSPSSASILGTHSRNPSRDNAD